MNNDPESQIMALLNNNPHEYAAKIIGRSNFSTDELRAVFTVRQPDVREYVREHGLRIEDYAEHHWLRFESREGKWFVGEYFPPEKTPEYWGYTEFETESEAKEFLLRKILNTTYVGIRF